MPLVFLILTAFAACPLIAGIGRAGVIFASEGEDDIGLFRLLAASAAGFPFALLVAEHAEINGDWVISVTTIILGSALGAAALIDRDTAWAPDVLVALLAASSMILGTEIAGWQMSPLAASAAGVGMVVAVNALWILAVKLTGSPRILPPADIISFALPFMIFGLSLVFVAVMLGIAVIGLICTYSPAVRRIVTNPEIGEKVLREMEIEDIDVSQGLTLLSISLPLCWIAILAWLI